MRRLTRRQRVAALVLAAVALAFATFDLSGGGLRGAHSGVRGALGALYRGTDAVIGPTRAFLRGLPNAGHQQDEIDRLHRENAALRGQLAASTVDTSTAQRLAALQLAADAGQYRIVPARVTATGPGGGFDWTVTLDVGTADGVRIDQTVTDGNALVGRVLHVNADSSTVLLGADPGSGIGVRDLRSGQLGVATGRGTAGFTLSPLDPAADLRVGDELRTGPVGGTSYVGGLAVGTISAVQHGADGASTATVRAASSPTGLDLVGVILVGAGPGPRVALSPAALR